VATKAGRSRIIRRRHTPEQIIRALREAEVGLANGKTVGMVSRFGRYGYRQITNVLRIEGWQVNHKLVRRWLARLGVQMLFIEPGSGGACTIRSDPTAPAAVDPPPRRR